jgi:hypothetical protein
VKIKTDTNSRPSGRGVQVVSAEPGAPFGAAVELPSDFAPVASQVAIGATGDTTVEEEYYEEYEYADYHEHGVFEYGLRALAGDQGTPRIEEAVLNRSASESDENGSPYEGCTTAETGDTAASGQGRREDIGRAQQCPKRSSYPRGRRWHVQPVSRPGGGGVTAGCVIGAVGGAVIAEFGTAGLAPEAGAIGGCAVGAYIGSR